MRLAKYHGLGNDFLVLLDLDGRTPVDGATARPLCDRHRGVGADGLIRATRVEGGDADVTMALWNADGGRAETSGNGLRCLAKALVDAGLVQGPAMTIATDAGVRRAVVHDDGTVTVGMGTGRIVSNRAMSFHPKEGITDHRFVDMGNPHLVLAVAAPEKLDVEEFGSELQRVNPGGLNVELVAPGPGADELTMRVWERGVGETQACGSGACAAAMAFRDLKEVGDRVTVHQPGGAVDVELLEDGTLTLTGPVEYVATVEVPCP
ncbi:MAG TPA: diaminopimelate epimerase [Acidimicrobiales bacterium]|nr:diaminopimelate epimerase [Acidimicrobiales bacterium]